MTTNKDAVIHSDGVIETSLKGNLLLENPGLNKGTAFSEQERLDLGLLGLLPPHIESLGTQVERVYEIYSMYETDLEKHIYLRSLQDDNETLFYRLIHDHLSEMMPIIYTPIVGAACQKFSEIYRRSRGLFIAYPERDRIDTLLENAMIDDVKVIVVTDGERILGLGDQGAGGLGISIGKLSLYSACGGINPINTLPIVLDAGTNNDALLNDPLYIGWRHNRIVGEDYYQFVDKFVQAVKQKWPDVLLQFEDFAQQHASPLLEKYRDQLCTFNDDIQGTAAVTAGTLMAAVKVAGARVRDQNIVFVGAGSAGCGIAEQMIRVMIREGLTEELARQRFFMIDRPGLLHDRIEGLLPFQQKLVQSWDRVGAWVGAGEKINLMDVVVNAKPSVMVGVSGQPGLFSREVIQAMGQACERPMIFPLSNPTSRIEATPSDLIEWTAGRALVATGSPFEPVAYEGNVYPIAQCNNSYIFPGMGLGIIAAGARRVTDEMFMAAAEALSSCSPALRDHGVALLPSLSDVRKVSKKIAIAVAVQAVRENVANQASEDELRQCIDDAFWEPVYASVTGR